MQELSRVPCAASPELPYSPSPGLQPRPPTPKKISGEQGGIPCRHLPPRLRGTDRILGLTGGSRCAPPPPGVPAALHPRLAILSPRKRGSGWMVIAPKSGDTPPPPWIHSSPPGVPGREHPGLHPRGRQASHPAHGVRILFWALPGVWSPQMWLPHHLRGFPLRSTPVYRSCHPVNGVHVDALCPQVGGRQGGGIPRTPCSPG